MALVPSTPSAGALAELVGGADGASIPAMVAAQRELLRAQVEQLHRLVVAQCRLTGVNPLAQEMAAGALSIKIGKKPRDLLNPKAVKYMQSLFAVKDTIGKKETREISALCGVTVTQVRDFFASQRSRVRKLVRLSREKATRIEASKACDNVSSISSGQTPSVDIEVHAEVIEPLRTLEPLEVLQNSSQPVEVLQDSSQPAEVPHNSAIPIAPPGATHPVDVKIITDAVQKDPVQVEVVPGVESEDKRFLESIFALMRKEETFSGQVKLMEWILQINNVAVLSWFLTMGGLTIVSAWLSQAASEEQTSVILVIFKVLLHLPLHKALPVHMSAVLQTINRLRFYRAPDISNRARHLLSRLSKVLVRSQALKKPLLSSSKDSQKELICKQRISEILRDESWKSDAEIPDEILALTESANESRKPEPRKTPMLLTASADESNKKNSLQTKSKERRKVLLVEHPNRKAAGKNPQVARSVSTNNSRPLSADDIQKAKMRAMFMQEKYGKVETSKAADKPQIIENQKPSGLLNPNVLLVSGSPIVSNIKRSLDPSPSTSKQSTVPLCHKPEISDNSKPNLTLGEHLIEMLESKKVRWQAPPEVWIDPSWSVGTGDKSKELEVQTQRNRREKETFYVSLKDVPPNPKDPWDMEMDFDDSLTPEIPIDQPPDVDTMEVDNVAVAPVDTVAAVEDKQVVPSSSVGPAVAEAANGVNGAAAEPDLELLSVLLKNPELVFALTSGQGQILPSEQTVALLDMLKQTGLGISELINGLPNGAVLSKKAEPEPETIPASLPSPTPPSDPAARASWRSEFQTPVRVPTLQQPHFLQSRGGTPPATNTVQQSFSSSVSSVPSQPYEYASVPSLPAQMQTNVPPLPQLTSSVSLPAQQHIAPVNTLPNRAPVQQHAQSYTSVPDSVVSSIHQPVANKTAYDHQNISNHAMMNAMPQNAAYTAPSWQSSAANVTNARRQNTPPDPWAARATNSFDAAPSNSLSYPTNQNTYGTQNTYNAYGSAPVAPHAIPLGQGLNRNGYAHTSEYQMLGRDDRRHSRSPEFGAGRDYSSSHSYNREPSRQGNSGHQSYNPEPSRQWNAMHQSHNPEPSRQWNVRKQVSYHPSNGRRPYNRDWDHDRYQR